MNLQSFWQNNKKTVITAIAIFVAVLALGGIGRFVYEMNETKTLHSGIYQDLLALENNPANALTPAQAKSIIPLLEQIKANATTTGADFDTALTKQTNLEKSIYSMLTQQQYFALLSGGGGPAGQTSDGGYDMDDDYGRDEGRGHGGGKGGHGGHGGKGDHGDGHRGGFGHDDEASAIDQALPDIVIKQLAGKAAN